MMGKDSIFDMAIKKHIVANCKDANGKVNVNKALSVARAKGHNSAIDRIRIRRLAEIENNKNK